MATTDCLLSDIEFVAFDLETTGLFPISCRIVEFGAVRFRLDGTELSRFEQLVYPECPIPPLAQVFRKTLGSLRRVRTVNDLFRISAPLRFEDGGGLPLEAPVGFEELTVAIEEEHTIVMVYESVSRGPARRRVTPRSLLESRGRAYLTAFCHIDQIEKTYRIDRIRKFWIE